MDTIVTYDPTMIRNTAALQPVLQPPSGLFLEPATHSVPVAPRYIRQPDLLLITLM
jgi:hypothetical protein